ncbi:GTP pyrophosphokinase family protein [Coprobacillus sp. OF03-2AA]|nr:GTP pyrophosphokinase family protein [Coprobacillus sp. OF03-2AA]
MKTSQKIKQSVVNNLAKTTLYENVTELLRMQQIYEAGIKEVRTKLEILDAEFKVKHDHNPIHHIESRLKSPESILKKAISKDIPVTERSLEENIHDIAGIRVICNYVDDVYKVAQLLTNQDDIQLIEMKDYIQNPKESGYMSLHLVLEVPIFLSEGPKPIHVEVQLRTIAMDFWASLEHKLKYKTDNNVSDDVKKELQECAKSIAEIDLKMQNIHNRLNSKIYKKTDTSKFVSVF